jgi:hypothetical protein
MGARASFPTGTAVPGLLHRRISCASGVFFTLAPYRRLLADVALRRRHAPFRPALQRRKAHMPHLFDQSFFRRVRLAEIAVGVRNRARHRRDPGPDIRVLP